MAAGTCLLLLRNWVPFALLLLGVTLPNVRLMRIFHWFFSSAVKKAPCTLCAPSRTPSRRVTRPFRHTIRRAMEAGARLLMFRNWVLFAFLQICFTLLNLRLMRAFHWLVSAPYRRPCHKRIPIQTHPPIRPAMATGVRLLLFRNWALFALLILGVTLSNVRLMRAFYWLFYSAVSKYSYDPSFHLLFSSAVLPPASETRFHWISARAV